jgi:hypothetical protein
VRPAHTHARPPHTHARPPRSRAHLASTKVHASYCFICALVVAGKTRYIKERSPSYLHFITHDFLSWNSSWTPCMRPCIVQLLRFLPFYIGFVFLLVQVRTLKFACRLKITLNQWQPRGDRQESGYRGLISLVTIMWNVCTTRNSCLIEETDALSIMAI